MKKLIAIGEALIDFIPKQTGCKVKEVVDFCPKTGGAPANVCGAFTKLGGESNLITQLGDDPFGDKIWDEMEQYGIGTDYISRTKQANTALAFVSLEADGNREFSFYRKPSADMLLEPAQVKKDWFHDCFALHFCSVSLGDFPMKEAHRQAIGYAEEAGAIISFDPNIRLPLWEDHEALKRAVWEFLPKAHIIKLSDEEIAFITGQQDIEKALPELFVGNVQMVIYTQGSEGASVYTRKMHTHAPGVKVKAVDTTGAGDGFIGSFLFQMAEDNVTPAQLAELEAETAQRYLAFSNLFCAISVKQQGAIASYVKREEVR